MFQVCTYNSFDPCISTIRKYIIDYLPIHNNAVLKLKFRYVPVIFPTI